MQPISIHISDERMQVVPYINHSIKVATSLWEIGEVRNIPLLVGALLHDMIEDTRTTYEEIKKKFGKSVVDLVKEVADDKRLPKQLCKYHQIKHTQEISK